MAIINGTAANDVIQGTTVNDEIYGGAGNDRINGGAGDDVIFGGEGNDTLTGDAGNDTLYGGNGNDGFFGGGGNDTIYGEAGDDVMYGDAGNDVMYGGEGNDQLYGGTGDDLMYGGAGTNTISGGAGYDTFVLELSSSTLTAAMRADLATLKNWFADQAAAAGSTANLAAQTTGPSLTLAALGVTINTVENVKIFVDGVEKSLNSFVNSAPTAQANASVTTNEDTPLSGQISATDADGDTLAYAVQDGPTNGTLTLNATTGAYVYTPTANYNGSDSFKVVVTDPSGAAVVQTVSVAVNSVNDAPTAAAQVTLTTDEDTAIAGQVIASDIDGDTLGYAVHHAPAHGGLTLDNATGAYVYTPSANFNGNDSFQIIVTDGSGASVVQTISVGVAAVNDAPTAATNASISTDEDTAVSGQVIATDIDGDVLGYAVQQGPANGTLTLNATTGAYVYTPTANYNGSDTFKVVVTDPSGASVVQTVAVAIAAVNDAPTTAATASISTNEDSTVSGQVIATDIDGDVLAYAVEQGPANGTLTLNATTGAYVYAPNANYNGSDSFKVIVTDPSGASVVQTVAVAVAAVNDAPTTDTSLAFTTAEDTPVYGQIVASDVDGDTLDYSVQQAPANGTLTLNATTGAYVYTPAANYNGSDTFKVVVTDPSGASVVQTVAVAIAAVNDAPTAAAHASISTNEDAAVSGQVLATDIDGDVLGYAVQQGPANGTLTLNASTGAYVYTPNANYNGSDTFKVVVTDPSGASVVQTVAVAVAAVNDAPTAAANASIATNEDTAVSGQVVATDIDGDVLGYAVQQGPANGTLTLNATTGAYVYTPAANYNGSDTFKVVVTDPSGASVVQTVAVAVAAVNDAPTAAASVNITTNEDTTISGKVIATDVDGDTLAYTIQQGPTNGTLTLNASTGAYVYTPTANYNGSDTFKVVVTDPSGASVVQTVAVAVAAVNDAPTAAANASIATNEDTAISGKVIATDIDGDTLAYAVQQGPANGTLTLNATTGAYVYTPAANYNGSDTFKVVVTDPSGASVVQTVAVAIAAVNDAPTAAASVNITTNEDTTISGKVIATDVDGDTLAYAVQQAPANGALTLNAATGAYVYAPAANYNGSDSFKVSIKDPSGATVVQTVTIGVTPVNDAVTVAQASVALTTQEDKALSGQVVASDVDGDVLAWSLTTAPTNGTVSLDTATGKYTYTPVAYYSGNDSFFVTVSDPAGTRAVQRIDVTISALANHPTLAVVNTVVVPKPTPGSLGLIGGLIGTLLGTIADDMVDAGIWEDVIVALEIDPQLVDRDGSETLSLKISDVPSDAILSAGTKNADGSWSVSPSDLSGLTLSVKTTSNFTVKVEATATESNGATATKVATIDVVLKSDGITNNGTYGNDTITGGTGNDKLSGGSGNDTIYGGAGADKIDGGNGNDVLYGGDGNDYVSGGAGNDTFMWDAGNDVYAGGSGYDTLSYAGAGSGITADLTKKVIVGAASGTDSIYGSAIEKIIGTSFNDTFYGSSGVDTIDAGAGNDWLRGFGGADILTGGAGNDTFYWEKADVGSSVDRITDFTRGDVLDFTKLITLGAQSISNVVKLQDTSQGAIVSAKIDGTFVQIATLENVTGKTAADLFHDGQLLVG